MTADDPGFVPQGYQTLKKLGSGQTSHVYLARNDVHGEVALKLPREELRSQPMLQRMFENEVQITLSLEHENIVRAFEGYPTGAQAFLALEYCAGGTLDQLLLERGSLPLEQAVRLIANVARGLEHSHGQQVLHRDVKPANVFLTTEGLAKLGDFGTGMFLAETNNDRVGTAFYMAPEIFEGEPATVESDVYSLGILAYEVLTGVRPFQGDSYERVMMLHLSGLPKNMRYYREDLPRGLAKVVSLAMSRDAGRRYQSVRTFLDDFQKVSDRMSREIVPGRAGRKLRVEAERTPETVAEAREGKDVAGERQGFFGWFRRKKS